MILLNLYKNKNKKMPEAYGKYYARPAITQTIGIDGLSEHMSSHNTPFSPGAVKGMLTDMVICIRELCLQGIAVKIDNLAIFSIGIKHKEGANSEKEFTVAKNVEGVRLRARATGELVSDKLKLDATLKKASALTSGDGGDDSPTTPSGGDNKGDAGSTTPTTPSGGGSGSSPSQGSGSTSDGGGGSTPSGGSQEGGGSSSGSDIPKEFD